jgi:hypothetical protein
VGGGQPPVEILIGADVAGKFYTGNMFQLRCGLIAVQTWLGWVIMGKAKSKSNRRTQAAMLTTLLIQTSNLEDLWKLEAIGITDPCENKMKDKLEKAVLDHFAKTVEINSEGRYEVRLPWLDNCEDLPDNKVVAEKRLASTAAKLRAENKFEDYNTVF